MKREFGGILFALLVLAFLSIGDNFAVKPVCANSGTNVGGIISQNTIWTKENSPYVLIGNILVEHVVTFNIQAGVTIDLCGYYIMVNGTLCAQGSEIDKIYFNNGSIIFTKNSNGWNEQTGSGCIIENAVLNLTSVTSENSLKINSNLIINSSIVAGNLSIISKNIIKGSVSAGNSSTIYKNNITGFVSVGDFSVISSNTIPNIISAGKSCIISNNTIIIDIDPSDRFASSFAIENTGESTIVINNTIQGNIRAHSTLISNNTIIGGWGYAMDIWGRPQFLRSAIFIDGISAVSNNIIIGRDGGIGITIDVDSNVSVHGNIISGFTYGINAVCTSTIEKNNITENSLGGGIAIGKIGRVYGSVIVYGTIVIRNNIIANNGGHGICGPIGNGGKEIGYDANVSLIIEDNLIANNTYGIESGTGWSTAIIQKNIITCNSIGMRLVDFKCSVRNNTIAYNSIGIQLENSLDPQLLSIIYNNIQDNKLYNFKFAGKSNFNVTYNWWGTTNITLIEQTIYDYYDDFFLGKVTFIPFLAEPNLFAPQDKTAPSIIEMRRFPEGDVAPNQSIKVLANVSDSLSGVKNVILSYSLDGSSWTNVTMTFNSTTSQYEGVIIGQQAGTQVKYKIIAYDNAGNYKIEDNNSIYYAYTVVPEFSSTTFLLILLISSLIVVTLWKPSRKETIRNV